MSKWPSGFRLSGKKYWHYRSGSHSVAFWPFCTVIWHRHLRKRCKYTTQYVLLSGRTHKSMLPFHKASPSRKRELTSSISLEAGERSGEDCGVSLAFTASCQRNFANGKRLRTYRWKVGLSVSVCCLVRCVAFEFVSVPLLASTVFNLAPSCSCPQQ